MNDIIAKILKERLSSIRDPSIKAILLFGSRARGESEDKSDVDLLVLHEGYDTKDPVLRRREIYNLIRDLIGEEFESLTVIDMEFKSFISPVEVSSLLLNIYWDAKVVYDLTGLLESFLNAVRDKISKSGLKRVKDGKAYYWILPKPMKEVKIL